MPKNQVSAVKLCNRCRFSLPGISTSRFLLMTVSSLAVFCCSRFFHTFALRSTMVKFLQTLMCINIFGGAGNWELHPRKKAEWSMNRWKLLCNSLLELHCSCLNNNMVKFENSAVKSRVDLLDWVTSSWSWVSRLVFIIFSPQIFVLCGSNTRTLLLMHLATLYKY
jgi:hypothetical protein